MPIKKDSTAVVTVYVPKDKAAEIKQQASKAGISVSAFVLKNLKTK